MTDTTTAIANLNRTKQLAHQVRTQTEGMICDMLDCTRFATVAIVHNYNPDNVDLTCDNHHDPDANGFHVTLEPLSADVAALHKMLGR